jgi:maltose/moltooligosaccharide transporter
MFLLRHPMVRWPTMLFIRFISAQLYFFGAIMVTIIFAKEYPPKEYEQYHGKPQKSNKGIWEIFSDFSKMPKTMKQLGLVQFFSWFALFGMWVFTTPAIAHHIYNLPVDDTSSDEFRKAGNWVGIIFGVYNLVSAIYAIFLPAIARKIGRKLTHAISLTCGGAGLISMFFASSPEMLIFSMIGVGIAWASILAMPYAILAGSIPAGKNGCLYGYI